ncbi:MAG: hypothetical protein ACTSU5_17540 [Promethearchaeota archaeon]
MKNLALGTNEIVVLITLFIIYGIFLLYDLFGRDEPLGHLAYIMALVPGNYLWYLFTVEGSGLESLGSLGAYLILVILWLVPLLRDLFTTRGDNKDLDDVVLFLVIGIIVQLILSAVLPSPSVIPSLQAGCTTYWKYFYLPDLGAQAYSSAMVLSFKLVSTLLVLFVIIPLILDLKGESVAPWIILIIVALFAIPLAYISWLWLPDSWYLLLFLELVILAIVFLRITTSGNAESD